MNELRDFAAKADRFLRSAARLYELGDYDSCASRCYYAMFFMAQAALLTKGVTPASHKGVLSLFSQHFVKTGVFDREMAKALNEAYDKRLTGDYSVGLTLSREEAEQLLNTAREFIAKVSTYLEPRGGK